MIKTLVWSVVLYGSETWTMRKADIRRLEAFEMWTWRRMEKIRWTEHITNEEVMGIIGEERVLIRTIRERQRKWIGHTLRGDSLLRTVIEGKNGGEKDKRKTKTDDAGLDDDKRLLEVERGGPTTRRVATSDI